MAGISIVVELDGDPAALAAKLAGADLEPLMSNIGWALESSTRERIESTKTAPDGTPWQPNRAGTSTLRATGRHLLDSIAWIASSDSVEVGAAWEFAHIHQDGATITPKTAKRLAFLAGGKLVFARRVTIPARPFVGVSADDEREILRLTTDFFGALAGGSGGRPR